MKLVNSLKRTVEYFFYFIGLSFYFSYGYFYLARTNKYNELNGMSAM